MFLGSLQFFHTFCLYVSFIALRLKSTAIAMAVHLTKLFFLRKLEHSFNQYLVHMLSLVTDNSPS